MGGMNKATILLIDDDPDFVEATCAVLESVPYEVLVARNGDEGLAKAREARPDLVILDMIMPIKDGFQVLEELQADLALAQVPVMLLTGLANGVVRPASVDTLAAVAEYIDKPVKPTELLQRVEKLLGL
jgi:DNA-binding response OmpR family regulator